MIAYFVHKFILKFPSFFSFIYAYLIFYFLCNKKITKKNKLNLLILNKHRFLGEIESLNKRFNFNYIIISHLGHSLISEPFVKLIRSKKKNNKWYEIYDKKYYKDYLKLHADFLSQFLKYFKQISKINTIITPSIWYSQDKAWEIAAKQSKIKYISLHRENTKDKSKEGLNNISKSYKYFCPFYFGDYIFVFNKIEKKILLKSNIIKSEKHIIVVGCSRIDELYEKKINTKNKNYITLFSFFENALGYNQKGNKFIMGGFTGSGKFSTKKYFNKVHQIFFEAAIQNKKQKYIIKLKFNNIWKNKILEIKKKVEKKYQIKIDNVEIIGEQALSKDILSKSKVVIGINSLSLIEARIMGIPVIVPVFEEFKKHMKKNVYFSEHFNYELKKVENEKLFQNLINSYSAKKFKKKKILNKKIVEDYLGFYDNKSSLRTYQNLKKLNKNSIAI